MDASVTWDHGLTFKGTADSGFRLTLGTSKAAGGDDDGFRPMELLLVGVAGCTAMDVISILKKKRQDVTGFEVKVHGERAAQDPKVFTAIEIEYIVRGRHVEPAAVERSVELSMTKYCSASATLAKAATITHKYTIVEEGVAEGAP